ncbi:unnamed protein product [Bathycoccus prasinos]
MTGIIFAHFPNVCTGNDKYFNASYWHVVATTLDKDTTAYRWIPATGVTFPFVIAKITAAMRHPKTLFDNTKKTE